MITSNPPRIVDFPWEVLEYLGWLRQRAASASDLGSYLFDEPSVRFEAADEDVLLLDPGTHVEQHAERLRLTSPRVPSGLELDGFGGSDGAAATRWLAWIDGQTTLAEMRQRAGAEGAEGARFDALLRQAFGKLIFAPLALVAAERAVSGIEITRFPGSPYEIARPYWQNMGAVRRRCAELCTAIGDDESFLRQLRELHVVALMGEDLQTYYQPQSPISAGRAAPGRLMLTPSVVVEHPGACLFVRGPRVRAAHLGGLAYHLALYRSLGDLDAGAPRLFADATGLDWGRLVHARAASDAAAEDWFCPPRPIRWPHVAALRLALSQAHDASRGGRRNECIDAIARFHQAFIRLHPFHCGNQSLAMNVVGSVLVRLLGAGMPHLMLDHLALRLSPEAYTRVFRRAVQAYVDTATPIAARYLRLASKRAHVFDLAERLGKAASAEKIQATIAADPEGARLLLLID